MPEDQRSTVIPMKWCSSPKSFIANSCWREEMMRHRRQQDEAVRTML
jgi:hypothetical protein